MDLRQEKSNRWTQASVGMLLLACLLLALTVGRLAIGESFARYMTAGTAEVGFQAQAKPLVTVLQPIVDDGEEEAVFQVVCSGSAEDSGIRIRVYGFGEEAQAVTAVRSSTGKTYALTARALDGQTLAGAETGAAWVYVFTNARGEEILFDMNGEELSFALHTAPTTAEVPSAEASSLRISAEAVKK